jgi:hypothetical protein
LTNQIDILNSQVNECCGGVVPKELFLFLFLGGLRQKAEGKGQKVYDGYKVLTVQYVLSC